VTEGTSTEGVEIIEIRPPAPHGPAHWQPKVGTETTLLLQHFKDHYHLDQGSQTMILNEAVAILSRCASPKGPDCNETGLVIGYVQSGKTMSFTVLTALAHDNGFQMVVVIAGTSTPLLDQSTRRLKSDLQLETRSRQSWQHYENPSPQGNARSHIDDTLAEWRDVSVPENERKTVLITVMKHHRHLDDLTQILSKLRLYQVPVLVIDDEADQAGLNTRVRQGDESTTYQRLLALKRCLPHHSFLQYTATPQAPLLINSIDVLSPTFAEVLTPGPEYVGGKQFLLDDERLTTAIPACEIPSKRAPLSEPPESLLFAMRLFLLGVAAGILEGEKGNRSMLVHPSQRTIGHRQ